MEALEGGSSSASTSRSTKRNGMKRNETRREPRQYLLPTIREIPLFAYSLFPLLLFPSSRYFLFVREKNVMRALFQIFI